MMEQDFRGAVKKKFDVGFTFSSLHLK